jgi:membrane-bound lytic murein transglycosylase B
MIFSWPLRLRYNLVSCRICKRDLFALRAICVGLGILLRLHAVEAASPMATTVQAGKAFTAVVPFSPRQSAFEKEQALTPSQLVKRWQPMVAKASRRFDVPVSWINAVMRVESGGRTMLSEEMPMVSEKGAMGIMQVMPKTYTEMKTQYRLGPDPFDPSDNIEAGAAYLRWLKSKYAYPAMFAAYNAGSQRVDDLLAQGTPLPQETRDYVDRIGAILNRFGGHDGTYINAVSLTRPDGSPVLIDPFVVRSVRATLPGEYAPGVRAVVLMGGRLSQGVREDPAAVRVAILMRGGEI